MNPPPRGSRRGPRLLVVVPLVAGLMAAGGIAAEVALPPDFVVPKAETSPGPVTFSHRRHVAAGARCSGCHMRDIKMKRGETKITLEAKLEGKVCGRCHDGQTTMAGKPVFAIDECGRCHKE